MIRPRKMKYIELSVLKKDINAVLEYLGSQGNLHFSNLPPAADSPEALHIRQIIDRITAASEFLGITLKNETEEDIHSLSDEEKQLAEKICGIIENLKSRFNKTVQEKKRITDTISEAKAFSKMNMPFSAMEQLSFLTLRIGRLDQKNYPELREDLGERAVIIPLDTETGQILAASSKKGRFALDSALKKFSFEPMNLPQDLNGIPGEILESLEKQLKKTEKEIEIIEDEKIKLRTETEDKLNQFILSFNKALQIEKIKSAFTATENIYHFSGWTPEDDVSLLTDNLLRLSGGRAAINSYSPNEIQSVKEGQTKVPVSMKHSAFVKGFEGVVFSYGAPLYGSIDPTPLVAFFFTILFGLMFGDLGQGFILFLAGILIKKGPDILKRFNKYSTPLIAIGIASMTMGLLTGAVFTNERLLVYPTRAITGAITGNPVDRILQILPMASEGGSLQKMLFFFGFTVAVGVILNSAGLLINIINRCILKKYEAAFFSKNGLAGLLMFWYALFIALRIFFGGSFVLPDLAGLLLPVICIFFGPVIWRLISREKPLLEHGIMTFTMEGFVEVLETVSTYISNTVSFLRVGAFALSHAVLSFIVFRFSEELAHSGVTGTLTAALVMILGNIIIIVLEGMIVAIQVVRLQYYEFFNKFFIETGVEFAPFRFKNRT